MKYVLNGFFAGLIMGATCFLIQAYPTAEIAKKYETTRQTGFFMGIVVGGLALLGACVLYFTQR